MKISSTLKRIPWFEILLVVALLSISSYAAFSDANNLPNKWFTRDDAYYYFKVAQNISEGHGSTFDGINFTNGYHPLWMLVCIPIFALARFNLILPLRILLIVLAGLRAATSVLLYRLGRGALSPPVAMLMALYWAFDHSIHQTFYEQGLETGLAAFTLVTLLYLLQRFERDRKTAPVKWKHIALLALAATLVLFSRLDLVFLAGVFGLWVIFRDTPLRSLLPLDILALSISLIGAFIFRAGLPEYYTYKNAAILGLVVSLAVSLPLFYGMGLYKHPRSQPVLHILLRNAIANSVAVVALFVILFAASHSGILGSSFPRSVPLIDGALAFLMTSAVRLIILVSSHRDAVLPSADSPWDVLKAKWKTWLGEGAIFYGILGGALGIYMLWNRIVFGTASPVSGQVKRWWGSFTDRVYGGAARSPLAFFGITAEGDFNAWSPFTTFIGKWNAQLKIPLPLRYDSRYALLFFLVLLGLVLLLLINRRRTTRIAYLLSLPPLLAGAVLQILSYNITGYSALKEWYWVSQAIFLVLAGGVVLDILTQPLRRIPYVTILLALLALYWGASTGLYFARLTTASMRYSDNPNNQAYLDAVTFIEAHTEPGSLIGMTGGGNFGYFIKDRTIINMDGLINSYDYYQASKASKGADYLYNIGMDYIFANPELLKGQPYRGQYTDRLEVLDRYGGKAMMRFLPIP